MEEGSFAQSSIYKEYLFFAHQTVNAKIEIPGPSVSYSGLGTEPDPPIHTDNQTYKLEITVMG